MGRESQEARAGENEASVSQVSREYDEAGEDGKWSPGTTLRRGEIF